MDARIAALLADATVKAELRRAWLDSNPGVVGGHEEGGFICLSEGGTYVFDRWEAGDKSQIYAPPHPGGKRNNEWIVATFHTHPNTGNSYAPEPNRVDRFLVANDKELKTVYYLGEFVIAAKQIYLVSPSGSYTVACDREEYFAQKG